MYYIVEVGSTTIRTLDAEEDLGIARRKAQSLNALTGRLIEVQDDATKCIDRLYPHYDRE